MDEYVFVVVWEEHFSSVLFGPTCLGARLPR